MGHMYFVRHGQTVWNVENKICGSTDIDLTEKGHEQAVETGKKILSENIKADIILYSPLMRAEKTAKHISEITGIPAKAEPRLTEQNFGKYEGTPRNGEESMLHLAQRIYNLLDDVKASGKVCVLVAHNGIARVVNSYFNDMTNEEYADFGVKNCEILRYDF
uniref:histidine phosphatase family protein n=1 Tax=Ruminococcus bromii TaxID=40518 RepID=UPI003FEDF1E2